MDSTTSSDSPPSQLTAVVNDSARVNSPAMVDPFLVEALQNPRHRLTILRMELDVQKFLRNSAQQQFEFQHFPTSYLRLAAHRVAQHYGLLTMVQDNFLDGQGTRIVVRKTAESVYPAVSLSEIPVKQPENDKLEQKKIVLKPRPSNASSNSTNELGKRSSIRPVEERKEEYDRVRARIFSGPSYPEPKDTTSVSPVDGKNAESEKECSRNAVNDLERNFSSKDGGTSSRVAIIRDREKDRTDPDYDRSYERYVRNLHSSQNFNLMPFHMQNCQPPYLQYDSLLPQLGQMPSTQASVSHMNPYCTTGLNQSLRDAVYMQWPSNAMMYSPSYDQFRHSVFQAPSICQQPLSFDYFQNL